MQPVSLGECPACEEGELYAVVIPALKLRGELCRECEAFWAEGEEITEDNADQLVAMLHDAGIWPPAKGAEPAVFFVAQDASGEQKQMPW
jgi:hypothetical protein